MTTPAAPSSLPSRAALYWRLFWTSGTRHGLAPLLIAAVCEAESECGESPFLDKKGPGGRGDSGHGHGMMQIDDRTQAHRDFIAKVDGDGVPLWTLPSENIEYGTQVLLQCFQAFPTNLPAAVAAYNAGVGKVQRTFALIRSPVSFDRNLEVANAPTYRGNYVTRVLSRYRAFGGDLHHGEHYGRTD